MLADPRPPDFSMFRQTLFVTFALTSSLALPVEPTFATAESAITALYPDHELLHSASGDLNGDGRDEVAVLLRPPQLAADGLPQQMLRIVVLTTNAQGRLEHWTATKSVYECRHGTSVTIARGSMFLGCTSSLGVGGGENVSGQLQFAFRRGTLLLIGDETQFITAMNTSDESWRTLSRNLLTGRIVERVAGTETTQVDSSVRRQAIPLENWDGW